MRALDEEPMGTRHVSKTPAWHHSADSIAWFVDVAFRKCGRRGADFKTLNSLAIQVVVVALGYLGITQTPDAVSKYLVRRLS
jgi:hypothetical protein